MNALTTALFIPLAALTACNTGHTQAPDPPPPPTPSEAPEPPKPDRPPKPDPTPAATLSDTGVFPDLDPKVALQIAPWLTGPARLVIDPERPLAILYRGPLPAAAFPLTQRPEHGATLDAIPLGTADRQALDALATPIAIETPSKNAHPHGDTDKDGIPDPLDAAIGARKADLNNADYQEGYERLDWPGGDVPRERGVCTDVIVRALRNAGFDLQVALHNDMKRRRSTYGIGQRTPDKHIEHRRVRRQIVYFKAHHKALPTDFDPKTTGEDAWLPGDVVFMDTFPNKPGPDHVGIVSDKTDADGVPLIINNWTYGYTTRDMALLGGIPVTHRFRLGTPKRR